MSSKDGEFYPATVKDDLGKGKYVIECLVNKNILQKRKWNMFQIETESWYFNVRTRDLPFSKHDA